jgi:hypothetical protein
MAVSMSGGFSNKDVHVTLIIPTQRPNCRLAGSQSLFPMANGLEQRAQTNCGGASIGY